MALIKCYECEKEISDKAPACPHCGAPKEEQPRQTDEMDMRDEIIEYDDPYVGVTLAGTPRQFVSPSSTTTTSK